MKAALTGLFTSLAIAALLVAGSALPGFAQDAAKQPPATETASPPPASNETAPRPSILPKAAEPAPAAEATEPAPRRRYAHHYRRYGYYRTAYWEPFPIYWPHLYHNRIHWNRIPWFVRF